MAVANTTSPVDKVKLQGVQRTDRGVIGEGSYAEVLELEFRGLKCAGKRMKTSGIPEERISDMKKRFPVECEILCGLHHPCIVQFLGLWYEQDSDMPVLVMEYLHTTLSNCLKSGRPLPEEISYGILHDVALGLRYLHERSPSIIHRDLSANNILLTTNMNAKISDLGMAKIIDLDSSRFQTQTHNPGTRSYMPPEALVPSPKYNESLDIFSYGVLLVHMFSGQWPHPDKPTRSEPDPENPEEETLIPVSEFERRKEYLKNIGKVADHPLLVLIKKCLQNNPKRRPNAAAVHQTLVELCDAVPHKNRLKLLQQIEELKTNNEELRASNEELKEKMKHVLKADEPQLLHPQSKLQWIRKEHAAMPRGTFGAQAVLIGKKAYVGGGVAGKDDDPEVIFEYDQLKDEWGCLPHCNVIYFGMAQFQGNLITVGGLRGDPTGELYRFKEESQEWEQFLDPLQTARFWLSVATTQSAIISIGGATGFKDNKPVACNIVEVYNSESCQWHTAEQLPYPGYLMSSTVIGGTYYQLGGVDADKKPSNTVLCASLTALCIQHTMSAHQSSSGMPVWKTLPRTPLKGSAAASLSGSLLTVGGYETYDDEPSPAVHIFLANSWVRVTAGDIPDTRWYCTAVQLVSNQLLVVGGNNRAERTKTVFVGSIAV